MITLEDATGYADDLTDAQKAVILQTDLDKPKLQETLVVGSCFEHSDISHAIDQLLSMNLIEKEQSRLGGKFFHNYILLNGRGFAVRSVLTKRASTK